ncbi:TTC5 protein, partial [Bucco capensis]|nr:TTC5 protein [Bucco capensis]
IYNASAAWGVSVGDAIALPEPHLLLHKHQHQGKSFNYTAIRLASPLDLLVNGKRPQAWALAPTRLALQNPCDLPK